MTDHTNYADMAQDMDGDRQCFECEHVYSVLGTPPAVCPNCGSRAVPPVGTLTVLETRQQERKETVVRRALTGEVTVLEVVLADETDRLLVFYVTGIDRNEPRITVARYDDVRFSVTDEMWTREAVPDAAIDAAEDELGTIVGVGDRAD